MSSVSLIKSYSAKIMWMLIPAYLISALPAFQGIGPLHSSGLQAFLIIPVYISIGLYLSLAISIQKDHISFAKLAVCGIFLLSITGAFLFF